MILAIDPSLTGTAVVRGNVHGFEVQRFTSLPSGQYAAARMARYEKLVSDVMRWIGPGPFDAIFLEGYSYGSNDANARFITEYGGLLRWHLVDLTKRVWEVSPSTLKLFATGKGNADKATVMDCLARTYGVDFRTSDEHDAYGLFRIGLVMQYGVLPEGRGQIDAIERLRTPAPKRKKVRKRQQKQSEQSLF